MFVTNSKKKYKDDYHCAAHIHNTSNYIRSKMCLLMFSSPLHRLYSWSVSLRTSKCKHLRSGTTNSFILLQMSTQATNAANGKPSDVKIHKAVACPVVV